MIVDKIKSLVKKKEFVIEDEKYLEIKEIKVPDLKQYLINGYEEIRKVKEEKAELEEKLEETKKYETLYESTLITLDEFRKRDSENKQEQYNLIDKIKYKDKEICKLNEVINNYKIRENELVKRENTIGLELEEKSKQSILEYKQELILTINNTKGNISKSKLISLIERLGG